MSITLWKPEPDVILHQALGKLAEECAELSQALTRCLIQGYHEEQPATQKLNRTQLMEEIADVKAAMRWLFDVLDEPFKGESVRERRKFDGFKRWQSMLQADLAGAPPVEPSTPAPETHVVGAIAPQNIEELRRSAVMIRRWIPETFPEDENGQIHFARAVIESVASTIERALGIPEGSPDVTDHGSKSDLHPEYVTSEDGTDHGVKSTLHPGYVPPEGDA